MFILPACFNKGDVLYLPFDTYDSNGASVTISGLAVTDIEIYKDGSTTQRSSDAGYTLLDTDGIDFDGTTGLHGVSIDTGDNTDAGFWADGHQYWININAITVDSQTVRFTYYLALGYSLRPTTAGRTLDVSAGGEAGLDWANVGSPTTTVGLTGTTISTAQQVDVNTIKTQAVTCSGGVTIPAATLASTTNITAGTITTVTNLTNAPTNGDLTATMKTSVATAVLTATVETGVNVTQQLQLIGAATAGKCSGGPGSPVFKGTDGSTTRITGTADTDGNRTAATYNV